MVCREAVALEGARGSDIRWIYAQQSAEIAALTSHTMPSTLLRESLQATAHGNGEAGAPRRRVAGARSTDAERGGDIVHVTGRRTPSLSRHPSMAHHPLRGQGRQDILASGLG